jgi:TATA-box binding protein (TBP) (component of TFIID and TFIIIB)
MKEKVILIQPCVTDRKKVMADVQLGVLLDLSLLGKNPPKEFTDMRFSEKLGMAKFSYREKEILLFDNGRMRIKRAKNREDVLKTIDEIVNLLKHQRT